MPDPGSHPGQSAPKPDDYTDATVIAAEGARVGIVTCNQCGAAILLDPRDAVDRLVQHKRFHASLLFGGGGAGLF